MDNLTKEILVTIPVTEEHKRYLEEQASSGEYHCSFRYLEGSAVKKEDVERAHVIVGNVKAEFLPHAANLELFQPPERTSTQSLEFCRRERFWQTPRELTAWRSQSICWR